MRIIYMGTPEFAVPGLKILVENNFNIVAVITAPDKPQGRGLVITPSPVKEYALSKGLKVLQPEKLKDDLFLTELKSLNADLQIVVAFRMLPEVVWNMPPKGTFNLHASLLPQYRGAAPIHWAVINGEKETGVTTFFLKHEIDTGDVILQEKESILEHDTTGTLYEKLMNKGAELILKTVKLIQSGNYQPLPQKLNNQELKHAPKIFKEDGKINWTKSAIEIHNLIRGMNPFPGTYFILNGLNCKVFKSEIISKTISNSYETDGKTFLYVKTQNQTISILELQIEGKKRLKINELLMGYKIESVE